MSDVTPAEISAMLRRSAAGTVSNIPADLRRLADRLRAGDQPAAVADDLDHLALVVSYALPHVA